MIVITSTQNQGPSTNDVKVCTTYRFKDKRLVVKSDIDIGDLRNV